MNDVKNKKQQLRIEAFEKAVRDGVKDAGDLIVKTSSKCAKQVKDSPIGGVAANVDNTLKVFVKDKGDGVLMRLSLMSEPIVKLIVESRPKTFSTLDDTKKIQKLGKAFGLMTGMAVLTSVIKVFLNQAANRLNENKEITDDDRRICFSYVNDAFSVVLMTLSSALDGAYKTPRKERIFFADILANNEWGDFFKSDSVEGKVESTGDSPTEEQNTQPSVES